MKIAGDRLACWEPAALLELELELLELELELLELELELLELLDSGQCLQPEMA